MTWLTNPYRFGLPIPPGPRGAFHRVLLLSPNWSTRDVAVAEVEMAETSGGANIATTPDAISFGIGRITSNLVANAFDGNASTFAIQGANPTLGMKTYLGQQFPELTTVAEMRIRARADTAVGAPTAMVFQSRASISDLWDTYLVAPTEAAWTKGEQRAYSMNLAPYPKGIANALAWRIRKNPAGTLASITEMQFKTGIGGSNLCAGGCGIAAADTATGSTANAFTASTATYWQSSNSATEVPMLGYLWPGPLGSVPGAVQIRARSGATAAGWCPTNFDVEWTDDFETWTVKQSVLTTTFASLEIKEFAL